MNRVRMNRVRWIVIGACAALLVVSASAAIAADGEGDGVAGTPFLEILLAGAEWPGVVIGFMSLASVTIIVENFLTVRRATTAPAEEIEAARAMIEKREFKEIIDYVRGRRSMFADVLTTSLRHGRHGFDAMHEAAEERTGAWTSRLFRRVEYLHIIGNLGPLMGLLGTVLGMIRAFGVMQAMHGAYKPEDLAGGISLALVNTFLGLAVAIISLGFFGICRNRVDSLTIQAHAAVVDVLEYFRPAPGAVAGTAPAIAPSAGGMATAAPNNPGSASQGLGDLTDPT